MESTSLEKPKDFFTAGLLRTHDTLMHIINLEMYITNSISRTCLAMDPGVLMNHVWIQILWEMLAYVICSVTKGKLQLQYSSHDSEL